MKYRETKVGNSINILSNDHYAAVPYDLTVLEGLAKDGVIVAGTIVPANDSTAVGVLLTDVKIKDNPNGTVVLHGFIDADKLPEQPTADAVKKLKEIYFLTDNVPVDFEDNDVPVDNGQGE